MADVSCVPLWAPHVSIVVESEYSTCKAFVLPCLHHVAAGCMLKSQWRVHIQEQALLRRYNDKPLLTRPQQRFFLTPEYLEIDLDVHNYAYLARKVHTALLLSPVSLEKRRHPV